MWKYQERVVDASEKLPRVSSSVLVCRERTGYPAQRGRIRADREGGQTEYVQEVTRTKREALSEGPPGRRSTPLPGRR